MDIRLRKVHMFVEEQKGRPALCLRKNAIEFTDDPSLVTCAHCLLRMEEPSYLPVRLREDKYDSGIDKPFEVAQAFTRLGRAAREARQEVVSFATAWTEHERFTVGGVLLRRHRQRRNK